MPGTYPGSKELCHASGASPPIVINDASWIGPSLWGAGIISRVKCCPFKITINELRTHTLLVSSHYNNLGSPVAFFGPRI
jgi:hypothetical protein